MDYPTQKLVSPSKLIKRASCSMLTQVCSLFRNNPIRAQISIDFLMFFLNAMLRPTTHPQITPNIGDFHLSS